MSVGTISPAQIARADDAVLAGDWPEHAGPSWQSRCIERVLRLLPIKKQTASAAAVQARVRKLAGHPASHEPNGLGSGVTVTEVEEEGWPVYHTMPSDEPAVADIVFFLHGGGFINEIIRAHWKIVGFLTREAHVRCVVPIYPLTPGATAADIVPTTGKLLACLVERPDIARVIVVGNSAGAGLALAATQWLRDAGYPQPHGLVLISPGLDLSVSRPEQVAIAARDPINDLPGTHEMARLYAGDLDISHPYVSPLRGDFHGLAPMTVFAGTHDLLYPDSLELAAKARAVGVPVDLHLRRGQPHNYPGMPTPEGRDARAAILRAITRNEGPERS